MAMSIAKSLASQAMLKVSQRWKSLGPCCKPFSLLVMVQQLGSYRPPTLQFQLGAQWFLSLSTPYEASGWQVIVTGACKKKAYAQLKSTSSTLGYKAWCHLGQLLINCQW